MNPSSAPAFQPSRAVDRVRSSTLRTPIRAGADTCVNLSLGEPVFDTPRVISSALSSAVAAGYTRYCDSQGLPELREAIAHHESVASGRDIEPEHVLITHGGSAGLASVILATVGPGDVVAIEDPSYSLYADVASFAGSTVRYFSRTPQGYLDPESTQAAAAGARLIIVCQPSNPSGKVLTADDWHLVSRLAHDNDARVLSDEAYSRILYPNSTFTSILSVAELGSRGILCQTFSKTYAMTGWRLGYLIAPADVISAAALTHRTFNGSANTAVQKAAMAALRDAEPEVVQMLEGYRERRALMADALQTVPGLEYDHPDGAFYYWCRYPGSISSVECASRAEHHGVKVRPGREFGPSGEQHIRLSFAGAPDDIRTGVERLRVTLLDLPR